MCLIKSPTCQTAEMEKIEHRMDGVSKKIFQTTLGKSQNNYGNSWGFCRRSSSHFKFLIVKIKYILFLGLLAPLVAAFLLFFYLKSHSGIESMMPGGRCVKLDYSDGDRKDRVSVNCQDYNGEIYTIILRKFSDKKDSEIFWQI